MTTQESSLSHSKVVVGHENYPAANSLMKFKLYETKARFYLFGTDKSKGHWKVLKIDRCEPTELNIFEDPTSYTQNDCNDLLVRLNAGNQSTGGLKFVSKAYGILGFIKFLEPYYILLVTKRRLLGAVSGFPIYGISESRLICIAHPSFQTKVASSQAENRYRKLFNSIALTKDFFFSYTYRIMWSLQKNVLEPDKEKVPYEEMFVWNAFLTSPFREQVSNSQWLVALVHGFFKQMKLFEGGTTVTLIARRSRHFAGTRYLKRGVNEKGQVANEVETEQIVQEELEGKLGQTSSVVQHRGSIPLFWSQETSVLSPRPDIKLKREDSCYRATKLHFENLISRYGNPIIVLNLIKSREKKPRETILCQEYANAIGHINQSFPEKQKLKFIQWDLHKFSQNGCKNVLEVVGAIATDALNRVGFYCSSKPFSTQREKGSPDTSKRSGSMERTARKTHRLQQGVLRSNCIDCLDRTNVAQFSFGLAALGRQLQAIGLCEDVKVSPDGTVGLALMGMYEKMGDVLALQYGGSSAHNTVLSNSQGRWKAATQSLDFLRAIKRHYSNAYTDGLKQDAINIFLGYYRPELGKPSLWQLDSDYHLQLRRSCCNTAGDGRPMFKRAFSTGGILESGPAILTQALHFHGENLNLSIMEHIKEAASNLPQAGPVVEEDGTDHNKEKCLFNSRSFPLKKSQMFSIPILIIPETAGSDDFDQPSIEESFENPEEEMKELQFAISDVRMSQKEHHPSEEEVCIKGSLNVQSQCLRKHSLDYSEMFLSWIQSGHTCFL
ncbi:hypothetical protein GOP47_0005888 [Adiantum capillus-veneris]|uniref:SAC domain-containing protein n=1 Tax=Adiantum capillus-veneris TaxID=13818 RepID=A0A9D4ZLI4_ADICA|nr:hypothetical protein GOP47_0005888 [Adiantum capillus-veneris]